MRRQAIVIGLGQFGMTLARALTEQRVEVIAVDVRREVVQLASAVVAQAVCLDATDEEALATLAPARRDLCVCAIGDDAREASILVTALLRQLGAPRIIARAADPLIERILGLVGAHEIVNPERAFGERYARKLAHAGLIDEIPLGDDLVVTELRPKRAMIGRSLADLGLPRRFGLTVLGVREERDGESSVALPDPQRPLRDEDVLLVVGRPGAAQRLQESW